MAVASVGTNKSWKALPGVCRKATSSAVAVHQPGM